ncbi:MAG: hypothetical protein AAFQ42_08735 [Pseudomonadota bacterium]
MRTVAACVMGGVAAFGVMDRSAHAQSITTANARFKAWTPGDKETMSGRIAMNVLAFNGTVVGKTTKGVRCTGTVTLNLLLDGGSGEMSCNDGRSATFTYQLSSALPPRGKGAGKMNNGKTVRFSIFP